MISTDQRIVLNLTHPEAVNLDLYDMPGIQPKDNDEAEQLVREYIDKYNTNVIVLVVVRADTCVGVHEEPCSLQVWERTGTHGGLRRVAVERRGTRGTMRAHVCVF